MVTFSQQHVVHLRAKQVRIALTRRSWMMVRWLWRFDIMVSWGGSARLVLPSKKTPPCWFRLINNIYRNIDMHDIDIHSWVLVKLCKTKTTIGKMLISFHKKNPTFSFMVHFPAYQGSKITPPFEAAKRAVRREEVPFVEMHFTMSPEVPCGMGWEGWCLYRTCNA